MLRAGAECPQVQQFISQMHNKLTYAALQARLDTFFASH